MTNQLMTTQEVADMLAMSPRQVGRILGHKRIVFPTNCVRYDEADVQAYIEGLKAPRTATIHDLRPVGGRRSA